MNQELFKVSASIEFAYDRPVRGMHHNGPNRVMWRIVDGDGAGEWRHVDPALCNVRSMFRVLETMRDFLGWEREEQEEQ